MIITSDNRYKSTLKEFKKFETTNMSPNIKILWKKEVEYIFLINIIKNI